MTHVVGTKGHYIHLMRSQTPITVFYDGQCPVCRMEVRWYERIDKAATIHWQDIGALADSELPDGKSREALLGVFHVRDGQVSWHVGVDAFARIWKALPGLHHFAFLFSLPVIRQITGLVYKGFLRWQRWHRSHRRGKSATVTASETPK